MLKLLQCFFLALLLSACGGGSGDNRSQDNDINPTVNLVPIAKVESTQSKVNVGTEIQFDGLKSSDPEGAALSYHWQLFDDKGSAVSLPNNKNSSLVVSLSTPGEYKLLLTVNDGEKNSQPHSLIITATELAELISNAGIDQSVKVGSSVTLNGKNSLTTSDNIINYQWRILTKASSSQAVISNPNQVKAAIIPDVPGEYKIELMITDISGHTAIDYIMVRSEYQQVNSVPSAIIVTDKLTNKVNEAINLSGMLSYDPDPADFLTYLWKLESKPDNSQASLNAETDINAQLIADIAGEYKISLTVSDQQNEKNVSSVSISALLGNSTPLADAGDDSQVYIGDKAVFSGQGSYDPDGDILEYQWSIVSKPTNSVALINDPTQVDSHFIADISGYYVLKLQVFDGDTRSEFKTVVIQALQNKKPLAVIKSVSASIEGQEIILDGANSYDPENDELLYRWFFVSKPVVTSLFLADTVAPRFTPTEEGLYVIALVVSDGVQESSQQEVSIMVANNLPPVIKFSGDQERQVQVGQSTILNASESSDPEGSALFFNWQLHSPIGSQSQLFYQDTEQVSFTPDQAGTYTVNLILRDDDNNEQKSWLSIHAIDNELKLQGQVHGQLVDSYKLPLIDISLTVNGVQTVTNNDGYFNVPVQVDPDSRIEINITDTRVPIANYTSVAVNSNDFDIDIGQQELPLMQSVRLSALQGCTNYTGANQISFNFKLIEHNQTSFDISYEKVLDIEINSSVPKLYQLPAHGVLEVTSENELNFNHTFDDTYKAQHQYTLIYFPDGELLNIFKVCDK